MDLKDQLAKFLDERLGELSKILVFTYCTIHVQLQVVGMLIGIFCVQAKWMYTYGQVIMWCVPKS